MRLMEIILFEHHESHPEKSDAAYFRRFEYITINNDLGQLS